VARISRKVTDTLGLRAGEHVLDAGCGPRRDSGVPGAGVRRAVTGVTVSAFEVAKANKRAEAGGAGELAHFEYGGFTAPSCPDASFDTVLALESPQNAPDLDQVLGELFRMLRPGGGSPTSAWSRPVIVIVSALSKNYAPPGRALPTGRFATSSFVIEWPHCSQ
jgi:ubiquinone/menaquinone biosynthesis C-methylase UbiE